MSVSAEYSLYRLYLMALGINVDGPDGVSSNRIITSVPDGVTIPNGIMLGDTPSIDAFARLRVSNPYTLFENSMQYNASPLFMETAVTGAGTSATHSPNAARVRLAVTQASSSIAFQSKQYIRYQPGKSQLVLMTFCGVAQDDNISRKIGVFDDRNGIFFEISDTLYVGIRSYVTGSAVDTKVAQTNWNLDTLDGTGDSGITLDVTKAQIILIDYEWLGVGRVRVGFVIDGIPVYCHEFLHANTGTGVYMSTPHLPVRYEIVANASASGTHNLDCICAMVSSEGGVQDKNLLFSIDNGVTTRAVADTPLPVIAIRVGTVFPGGGSLLNRSTVIPDEFTLYVNSAPILYRLYYNPTITGGAWVDHDTTHSGVQYNITGTSISGGVVVGSGYVASANNLRADTRVSIDSDLKMTLNVAGNAGDTFAIVCTRVGAVSASVAASLSWKELY